MSIKAAQERQSSKRKRRGHRQASLSVSAACDRHGPVVFGYAGPEDPGHDHREKGEKALKECSVDLAICP